MRNRNSGLLKAVAGGSRKPSAARLVDSGSRSKSGPVKVSYIAPQEVKPHREFEPTGSTTLSVYPQGKIPESRPEIPQTEEHYEYREKYTTARYTTRGLVEDRDGTILATVAIKDGPKRGWYCGGTGEKEFARKTDARQLSERKSPRKGTKHMIGKKMGR